MIFNFLSVVCMSTVTTLLKNAKGIGRALENTVENKQCTVVITYILEPLGEEIPDQIPRTGANWIRVTVP